ncbi:MAG: hypothetical protein WKF62_04010 [Solirubrobacterales bacterium]
MRKKLLMGALGLSAVAASGAGAFAIAGDGFPGDERVVSERVEVGPITAREQGPVARAGDRRPAIAFFYSQEATVPAEGGGSLVKVRCPRDAGVAIDGGARTSEGIVIGYLSKSSPDGDTNERSYYVGIDDNGGEPGAGAFVEVQCAKGINVR